MENQTQAIEEPKSDQESLKKPLPFDNGDSLTPFSDFLQGKYKFKLPSPEEIAKREEEERLAREEQLRQDREQRGRDYMGKSRVPERHKKLWNELSSHPEWLAAYEQLKEGSGSGSLFVLLGNRGVGKTQLASNLIKYYCQARLAPAQYWKAIEVFVEIRNSFRKDSSNSEKDLISYFCSPALLVIDAMEERGETDFEDRILNHIIDKRYDSMKDTILITNQTPEAFAASSGPSIVSRIHETGGKIICDWPSFRTPKKDAP